MLIFLVINTQQMVLFLIYLDLIKEIYLKKGGGIYISPFFNYCKTAITAA